jgi:ABC-type transport system involved in multi-copper enzyme maturation permease subunit
MNLPPLVERELRAGARRPAFYWLRGLLALVLTFQACDLLNRYMIAPRPRYAFLAVAPPPMTITGSILLGDMSALLFVAVLLMGLVTADSISRERREGTLGLLLLTHVSPAQLVYGKLLSNGLNCFILLLGCLPALMVSVLIGGVAGDEAAMTGLGLVNTLFVSLAAGLWMSAVFRERRHAMAATLGLVVALAFGPELLGGSFLGSGVVPVMRLCGLSGWISAAKAPMVLGYKPVYDLLRQSPILSQLSLVFHPIFLCWFAATHLVGWFILSLAAAALAKNWQDEPHLQFREPEPDDAWSICGQPAAPAETPPEAVPAEPVLARASWLTDPRPWDEDPVEWRVRHLRPPEGLMWLAIALDFFAQFCAMGSMAGPGSTAGSSWGVLSFGGLLVALFAGGLLAWAAARFFLETRQQQDLELLLTSPVGSRNILAGQWRVLRQALTWPCALVLLLAVPSAVSLLLDLSSTSNGDPWSVTPTFLIAVNLVLEVLALCWMGMYFGLRARTKFAAIGQTIGLVQLLPLGVALALDAGWGLISDHSLSAIGLHSQMPVALPAALFLLGLAMYLGLRSRSKPAAAARAVGLVQLAPLVVVVVLVAGWLMFDNPSSAMGSHRRMNPIIPALLFLLAKNVALTLWAYFRLRRDLRLGRDVASLDKSARSPILQPA